MYIVHDHGSIVTLEPITPETAEAFEDVFQDAMWWVGQVVVEPRYLADVVQWLIEDHAIEWADPEVVGGPEPLPLY